MQIHFTPEQEEQLAEIASHEGTDAEELIRAAGMRMIEERIRFRTGLQQGIEAADRGEFVDHAEVWARVESILQS